MEDVGNGTLYKRRTTMKVLQNGGVSYTTTKKTDRKKKKKKVRVLKREEKNNPRRNVAPTSPRFMSSSQMVGTGAMPSPSPSQDKKKKPKIKTIKGGSSSVLRLCGSGGAKKSAKGSCRN